jgi:hypothetical protein
MDAEVGKLVGKLGQTVWAQVYDFTPEAAEKLEKRGRVVAVVGMETSGEVEQVEMVQVGREVLARLHELYYGEETGGVFEVLKKAVAGVRAEFEGVEIICVALTEELIYVAAGEGAAVWVQIPERKPDIPERQGWLIKPEAEAKGEVSFSGRAEKGEVLIIGNRGFFAGIPEGLLRAVVATAREEMESAVDMLAAVQRGGEKRGGEAGAIIRISNIKPQISKTGEEEKITEREETEIKKEDMREEKRNILGRVRKKIADKLPGGWKGRIYIRHSDREGQQKKMMYAGVGFLVLLLLMAGFGQMWLRQSNQKKSQQEVQIEKLLFDFSEAKAMAALNPARSRQLLGEIKTSLQQLEQSKKKDARVTEVEAGWEAVWLEANGVVKTEVKELVNLSLVRADLVGTRMAAGDGKLEVLDGDGGRVVEIEEKSGAGKVIAGGNQMQGAKLIATYPDKILIMTDKGIVNSQDAKVEVATDNNWGLISDMKIYAGNIYLLDTGSGQIWRYAVKTSGYGERQVWLDTQGGDEELKKSLNMAIDGSIWVAEPGGLLKYTRGVKEVVSVQGLDQPWGGKAIIFTSDEAEKIYVLDPGNNRVVVINKDAVYEKQLVNDNLGKMTDVVADEKNGKVYLLGEGKIWTLQI